jgi:hypothetical protein
MLMLISVLLPLSSKTVEIDCSANTRDSMFSILRREKHAYDSTNYLTRHNPLDTYGSTCLALPTRGKITLYTL